MSGRRQLHGDGLAGGRWLLAIPALLIVLLGCLTLRRIAPAADIPVGQQLESGFTYITTDAAAVACNRLEQFERLQSLASDSTAATAERYYRAQYPSCRKLKPGRRARVDDQRGLFGGPVCVRLEGDGRCRWTTSDAIERG